MIGLYFKSIAATSLIALCSLNSCKSTDSSDVKARVEEGSTGSTNKWTMVGERRDLYQAFGVTTCFAGNGIGVQQWKPGLNQNIATAMLARQLNGSLKTSTNLESDIGDGEFFAKVTTSAFSRIHSS